MPPGGEGGKRGKLLELAIVAVPGRLNDAVHTDKAKGIFANWIPTMFFLPQFSKTCHD